MRLWEVLHYYILSKNYKYTISLRGRIKWGLKTWTPGFWKDKVDYFSLFLLLNMAKSSGYHIYNKHKRQKDGDKENWLGT